MKRLFLGYETALWIWRKIGLLGAEALKPSRVRALTGGAPTKEKLTKFRHEHPDLAGEVLDVMVEYGDQRKLAGVKCHVMTSPLPDRSFYQLDDMVFVASPELCLMQLASKLTEPEAVKVAMEMCGSYAIDLLTDNLENPDDPSLVSRLPLTNVKRLQLYADRLYRPDSRARATRFIRWVADDSASPRETALYMLLCLPPRFGGYGIPKPELNARIDFDAVDRLVANSKYYKCDLYWEGRGIAVEYDSKKHHAPEEKQERDAVRRNVLQYKDVEVIVATRLQVNDISQFDKLARQVAKPLGKRLRLPDRDHVRQRSVLRRTLFDWDVAEGYAEHFR